MTRSVTYLAAAVALACHSAAMAEVADPWAADIQALPDLSSDSVFVAQAERRRPGSVDRDKPEATQEPQEDPNGPADKRLKRVNPPDPLAPQPYTDNFLPVPDRWRLAKDLGLVEESYFDPYNRNILKADRPFYKDFFFSLGLISDTVYEERRIPVQVSPATATGIDQQGGRNQSLFNQNTIISFILFQGDTVFRPPDYEFRFTPVFNYNRTKVEEDRLLNINAERGNTRYDDHVGIQELFFDKHLRNVSTRYDFDSLRVGIQPFSTDFRGFLFQDNQFGVRLFGNRDNNVYQYNLAWFRRVEKEINSGLNDLGESLRKDDVYIANVYRQDWPVLGFFSQATWVYNRNREGSEPSLFDDNGFIQRPASLGLEKPRNYDVHYVGYNGDGHFGRLNLTVSAYYAFGDQTRNVLVDDEVDIRAGFMAAEASVDFDWVRVRLSGLYASGDDQPFDDVDNGFDAIFENPVFAGADTSFWIRQSVPNIGGGGVNLSTRNGVLNNLRSSKEQGQSNFTNPGIRLLGVGADFDITPEVRLSTNFNHLWFDTTEVLEAIRNQGNIDEDIGWDLSAALIWRPYFTQNIVFRLSYAALLPGEGYKNLFGDGTNHSVLANLILTY